MNEFPPIIGILIVLALIAWILLQRINNKPRPGGKGRAYPLTIPMPPPPQPRRIS